MDHDNLTMQPTNDPNNLSVNKDEIPKPPWPGIRHQQVLLLFFGLFTAYSQRVNLTVAIVAWVDNSSNPEFQTFDWAQTHTGTILSCFFWGYIVSQIPAGILAQRFGAKIVLFSATVIYSMLTIMTPFVAVAGWEYVVVFRVISGLSQGCIYPSCHTLLAKWIHPSERSTLNTFAYCGTQIGTVVTLAISGAIATSKVGWPGIFYITGGFGLLWSVFWFLFGSSSPSNHHRISYEERDYIEDATATSLNRPTRTPWKDILTSKPFIALFIVSCTQNWGFWTLMSGIPLYMNNVLNFDLTSNGLISALPYLTLFLLSLLMGFISKYLIDHKYTSVTVSRKLFNSIGHWVPLICLIGLAYTTTEQTTLAVVLLTMAVGFNAGTYVGYLINHIDLAPNFAGIMIGITNGLGNFTAILAPQFLGAIISMEYDNVYEPWRIIFFVAAGMFLVGNLVFVIFGQATVQKWNKWNN